jgi:hypothetical protein
LRLCNFLIKKNARKISTFLYYRTSETNWRVDFWRGYNMTLSTVILWAIFFYQTCNLTLVKKYLKTAIIIDESLILAIVSRNYSTKPSYIFQLKRELNVWKYIFNLFQFEVLIQNRNPKFRSSSLFVLTFHEYKARFVFGFRLDYKLSLFIFSLFCVKLCCVLFMCYNQYKLINSSDPI